MALTADAARYTSALTHASNHRVELDRSTNCACFFCFGSFATAEIRSWIDTDQTALCPRCGIDSVLGTASGFVLDDRFLRRLHGFRFGAQQRSKTPR